MLTMTFIGANRDAWGYLMNSVSTEHAIDRAAGKAAYYMAGGTPPGTWAGAGARQLGLDEVAVNVDTLSALFGSGKHPVTGTHLGRAFIESVPLTQRVRARVAAAMSDAAETRSAETLEEVYTEEELHTPQRQSLAGFEFVFSPPKSVSSWWAIASPELKDEIRQAHHAAIQAVLTKLETDIVRTRTGTDGVAQQHIRGLTTALFDHWDSRDGDPQLHTHMLVSNRVQGADGRWRTIDSRWSLTPAVATAGEFYDTVLMDALSNRFGVDWTTQDVLEQPHRYQQWLAQTERVDSPATRHQFSLALGTKPGSVKWQLDAIPHSLNQEYSSRSRAINCDTDAQVAEYVRRYGRPPSARQVIQMRQRAAYQTRTGKQVLPLHELTAGWRQRAIPHVGESFLAADRIAAASAARKNDLPLWSFRADDVDDAAVTDAATLVLHHLATARSTWNLRNAETEVYRAIASWRFRSVADRDAAATRVTAAVLARAVSLTPANPNRTPTRFRTTAGEDMFHPEARNLYTTQEVWDAEERLLQAGRTTTAPAVDPELVARLLHTPTSSGLTLTADKSAAVRNLCTSGRLVDVLVGPAGAGKTTSLEKLRELWEAQYGVGSVRGLAPTARAAEVLADSLGIDTENTEKWLYETARDGDTDFDVELRAGDLLIIDEASIAGTIALDRLRAQAAAAGAKLLLVGDWAQLSAIDAGGAFGLLATDRDDVAELLELHRFTHDWEADASLLLRLGKTAGLTPYLQHGRISGGLEESMVTAAIDAWKRDESAPAGDGEKPLTSLLIASNVEMVDRLNQLARQWRIEQGAVDQSVEGDIASGKVSPGDRIVTRKNARRLRTDHDRWVRNNDEWLVVAVDEATGDLLVASGEERVTLPAAYCTEHVELAYATTAHRAQGRTVDTSHTIVDQTTTRETFYVVMTRGRQANHAYVVVDEPHPDEDVLSPNMSRTWRDTLDRVVSTRGGDLSAHDTLREEAERIGSIRQLAAEYQTLIADQLERDWLPVLTELGIVDAEEADSPSLGPLLAQLRRLSLDGADVPTVLTELLRERELDSAHDPVAVLHYRLDTYLDGQLGDHAGVRVGDTGTRIVGLIEAAPPVDDPEVAEALRDRELAIQLRAELLVDHALAEHAPWLAELGEPCPGEEAAWRRRAATVACYRDLYGVDTDTALGREFTKARIRSQHRAIADLALAQVPVPAPPEHPDPHPAHTPTMPGTPVYTPGQ